MSPLMLQLSRRIKGRGGMQMEPRLGKEIRLAISLPITSGGALRLGLLWAGVGFDPDNMSPPQGQEESIEQLVRARLRAHPSGRKIKNRTTVSNSRGPGRATLKTDSQGKKLSTEHSLHMPWQREGPGFPRRSDHSSRTAAEAGLHREGP
jgi:hypothetical protein